MSFLIKKGGGEIRKEIKLIITMLNISGNTTNCFELYEKTDHLAQC